MEDTSKPPTELEMYTALAEEGWLQNHRGWWHPPMCLASWPMNEAYQMMLSDKDKGLTNN